MKLIYPKIQKINKKRGKYKPREPLYYYYMIDGNIYKYTCRNKNRKKILDFRCSDTSCPAQANFFRKTDEFKLYEFTQHKEYEEHTYTFNEIYKNKFKANSFKEDDFLKSNSKKIIGEYFKLLFYENEELIPTEAKLIFHTKFPNIDITNSEIDNYIKSKHREMKLFHSVKILKLCLK